MGESIRAVIGQGVNLADEVRRRRIIVQGIKLVMKDGGWKSCSFLRGEPASPGSLR